MTRMATAIALVFVGATATAATCSDEAKDKKLSGAALNSFMKKCEADAKSSCEASAKDKKLVGAAKESFKEKVSNRARTWQVGALVAAPRSRLLSVYGNALFDSTLSLVEQRAFRQ